MTCYIVSFEVSSGATLIKLRDHLVTYNGYCPINATCWAIVTEKKSAEIRDAIGQIIDQSDRVFVIRSGTESAWRNVYGEQNSEWLKKNL